MRTSTFLQLIFGGCRRKLRLARNAPPGSTGKIALLDGPRWSPRAMLKRLKWRELGQQDKSIGAAEMTDAIATGRPTCPGPDFMLRLTELTIAIQGAGVDSGIYRTTTDFAPLSPRPETLAATPGYGPFGSHRPHPRPDAPALSHQRTGIAAVR